MTDLAEIRAEGQRLLAEYRAGKPQAWLGLDDFLWKYADVLLADPAPMAHDDVAHDEGWAIAIISNVDAPEVGWPHQTEEWRTAARSWLDAVHTPAPVGLTEAEQKSLARSEASQIPDGHTRIDGKLFRLERHGDLNRYGLVRVEATDD